jgi:aryl-alcohol dehydrogenase-like predicted oxidoreductase
VFDPTKASIGDGDKARASLERSLKNLRRDWIDSNPLVDVCLLGMHSAEQVRVNVAVCEDTSSRIDLNDLHTRYADKQAK